MPAFYGPLGQKGSRIFPHPLKKQKTTNKSKRKISTQRRPRKFLWEFWGWKGLRVPLAKPRFIGEGRGPVRVLPPGEAGARAVGQVVLPKFQEPGQTLASWAHPGGRPGQWWSDTPRGRPGERQHIRGPGGRISCRFRRQRPRPRPSAAAGHTNVAARRGWAAIPGGKDLAAVRALSLSLASLAYREEIHPVFLPSFEALPPSSPQPGQ